MLPKKMLPTPDTSHVPTNLVYDPAEDSYLLLDTLSSDSERAFLRHNFPASASLGSPSPLVAEEKEVITAVPSFPSDVVAPAENEIGGADRLISTATPLVLELGTGSGIVSAFLSAHAGHILGRRDVLVAATDLNPHACKAAGETIQKAIVSSSSQSSQCAAPSSASSSSPDVHGVATFLDIYQADLASPLRPGQVDILIFNPPYVPTEALPSAPLTPRPSSPSSPEEEEKYYLSLAFAGGHDGMEVTSRLVASLPRILSPRGCAYILLCRQNDPEGVKRTICGLGAEWRAGTVGSSGKTAGWEKLVVVRAWREGAAEGL